jgi:hypothetical protein
MRRKGFGMLTPKAIAGSTYARGVSAVGDNRTLRYTPAGGRHHQITPRGLAVQAP